MKNQGGRNFDNYCCIYADIVLRLSKDGVVSVYSFRNVGAVAGIGTSILAAGIVVTGVLSFMSL